MKQSEFYLHIKNRNHLICNEYKYLNIPTYLVKIKCSLRACLQAFRSCVFNNRIVSPLKLAKAYNKTKEKCLNYAPAFRNTNVEKVAILYIYKVSEKYTYET